MTEIISLAYKIQMVYSYLSKLVRATLHSYTCIYISIFKFIQIMTTKSNKPFTAITRTLEKAVIALSSDARILLITTR